MLGRLVEQKEPLSYGARSPARQLHHLTHSTKSEAKRDSNKSGRLLLILPIWIPLKLDYGLPCLSLQADMAGASSAACIQSGRVPALSLCSPWWLYLGAANPKRCFPTQHLKRSVGLCGAPTLALRFGACKKTKRSAETEPTWLQVPATSAIATREPLRSPTWNFSLSARARAWPQHRRRVYDRLHCTLQLRAHNNPDQTVPTES